MDGRKRMERGAKGMERGVKNGKERKGLENIIILHYIILHS